MKQLKASALPTVMVICVLIFLLVLFAIALFDINILYYSVYHTIRQRKEDINSAFVLYCNDSTLLSPSITREEYTLYEDRVSSTIYFHTYPWGLYECVTASTSDEKLHSIRFLGKTQDCHHKAALWVCSRDMVLSFAGTTEIEGKTFIPINGINYIQLDDAPFSGKEIANYNIDLSERDLPPVDSLCMEALEQFKKWDHILPFPPEQTIKPYYSFKEETSHFFFPTATNPQIRGNVVLHADEITISSEAELNDLILIARKVVIEKDFSGSLQIIARDTVLIGEGVQLRYPSGVYLKGDEGRTYLSLGEHSRLNGYAIIFGDIENSYGLHIENNYVQDSTAIFNGLLYVDGIADIRGKLSGGIYLKECYYLPENGIYANTIYNAEIFRNDEIAYPFFFSKSAYRRKEIKTVH